MPSKGLFHKKKQDKPDDDQHHSPFGEPSVVCSCFYNEEVRKSAGKRWIQLRICWSSVTAFGREI